MKSKYLIITVLLTVIIPAVTFSCVSAPVSNKKSIVVTYSLLGSIVKELVGDSATVTVSVPNGQDPHEWSPSAKDIEAINKADLVIQNGLGLESGLEKTLTIAQNSGVKFFTAADNITVRHVSVGEGIPSDDPDQAIGAADPHFWMDPLSMKSVIAGLIPVLKNELDIDVSVPAAALATRLDSLNTQITGLVVSVPAENRKLVTGHESMGYFARRYDFKLVGVIIPGLSTQAQVSAADLAALKTVIQRNQVRVIFTELGTSPVVAQEIGSETGVRVVELTTHKLPADGSYFTFMIDIADTITNALK